MHLGLNPCFNGIWSARVLTCTIRSNLTCLNPCSNGIWSARGDVSETGQVSSCLNPCSNGIWSARHQIDLQAEEWIEVLILVLMEYGLRGGVKEYIGGLTIVLILVLMEYGLREGRGWQPCPSGRRVLILVLMEYGLRVSWEFVTNTFSLQKVLILVLMEYGLRGSNL